MTTLFTGQKAPDFTLPKTGGGTVSLSDYAGKKLVLFFFPKANTPGCTREACGFSAALSAFSSCNTSLLGISNDPIAKLEKFITSQNLMISLASDEALDMLSAYGVWTSKSMYGKHYMGIERTTVLIDEHGCIARLWQKVKVPGHVEEVFEAVKNP